MINCYGWELGIPNYIFMVRGIELRYIFYVYFLHKLNKMSRHIMRQEWFCLLAQKFTQGAFNLILSNLSEQTMGRTHNTREKYWTSRSRVGVQKVPEPKIGTHNNLRGQVPIGTRPWTSRSGTWPLEVRYFSLNLYRFFA